MAAQPPDLPPRDVDPDERDLSRRSGQAALGPWLIVGVIALVAVLAFVVLARG
jgi:hypothetical protein